MLTHILSLSSLLLTHAAAAQIELVATASIPGDARDLSRLPHRGEPCPPDRLGGFGSGIEPAPTPGLFFALADRGPFDGAADYPCRVHTFQLALAPDKAGRLVLSPRLTNTTLLTDENARPFTGSSAATDPANPALSMRLDPEGIRLSRARTLFISEEYAPAIDEFSLEGRRLRRLTIPTAFLCPAPHADAPTEARNPRGRQPNRGFEGLAISPDGSTLFAILQSPLTQDNATDASGKRRGTNIRILEVNAATGSSRQLVYPLSDPRHGVSEILAITDQHLLVLERDGKAGADAVSRALYRINTRDATDVSAIDALPARGLPAGVTPVSKSLFLDFMDDRFALAGPSMPEKIEGLCYGPTLDDGRVTLLVTTDNDLKEDQPSWFWLFAMPREHLREP